MEVMHNDLQVLKVLLVEDDPIVQKVHKAFLQRLGCQVDIAADGKQALAVNWNNYDIFFLDGNLPDMDGFEIARHLRCYEKQCDLIPKPLIMLSAFPYEIVQEKCEEYGIDDFAIKPVKYELLQAMLLKWCSQNFCSNDNFMQVREDFLPYF